MRIPLEALSERERSVPVRYSDSWALEAATRVLEAEVRSLDGRLILTKVKVEVKVAGQVKAHVVSDCHRCGEPVEYDIDSEVVLAWRPAPKETEEDVELSADELDVGFYTGDFLDVADVLGEILSLAQPARVVCLDVPACDLRTQAILTSASQLDVHPHFAALKKLLPN